MTVSRGCGSRRLKRLSGSLRGLVNGGSARSPARPSVGGPRREGGGWWVRADEPPGGMVATWSAHLGLAQGGGGFVVASVESSFPGKCYDEGDSRRH